MSYKKVYNNDTKKGFIPQAKKPPKKLDKCLFWVIIILAFIWSLGSILGGIAYFRDYSNASSCNKVFADEQSSISTFTSSNFYVSSSRSNGERVPSIQDKIDVYSISDYDPLIFNFRFSVSTVEGSNSSWDLKFFSDSGALTSYNSNYIFYLENAENWNQGLNFRLSLTGTSDYVYRIYQCRQYGKMTGQASETNFDGLIIVPFIVRCQRGFNAVVHRIDVDSTYFAKHGSELELNPYINYSIPNKVAGSMYTHLSYMDSNGKTLDFYFVNCGYNGAVSGYTLGLTSGQMNNYYLRDRIYYTIVMLQDLGEDSANNGFNNGYREGYDSGYNVGVNDGINTNQPDIYNRGYNNGYNAGHIEGVASSSDYSFMSLLGAVVDAPLQALTGLLSFDVLGVNMANLFYSLVTLAVVIFVIKLII